MREYMVEAAAEANEELMDKYLEEGELTKRDQAGIASRTLAREIVPSWVARFQEQRCPGDVGCRDRLLAVARSK